MERVALGRTGLTVSKICLGTWQAYGWATSDDEEFKRSVEYALELGINFFDTALEYGKGYSEKLLGSALKEKRKDVIIATKAPYRSSAPDKLREVLETSLKNLNTDYIDLYQQHWPSKDVPLEDTIGEMEKLRDEGKIRAIGVSNWMKREWDEFKNPRRVHSLQPCYSLLWRHIEKDVVGHCVGNEIAIIPYSPLCQGLLSGKFRERNALPRDSRRQNVFGKDEVFPSLLTFLDFLSSIGERNEKAPAELALNWLAKQRGVTSLIVGCSKSEHVAAACNALEFTLSEEDTELLSKESEKFISLTEEYKSLWDWNPRDL